MPAAPSLLIVPYRSKTGKLYSQIPTSGAGDFTVTRNTEARRFDSAGLVASVASGIPRLDYYTSGGVTGCPALLVEPAATNLLSGSADFSNTTYWTRPVGANVTGNVAGISAPDGTNTASLFQASGSSATNSRLRQRWSRTTTGSHAFSVFIKGFAGVAASGVLYSSVGNSELNFAITSGGVVSLTSMTGGAAAVTSGITQFSDGWYRITAVGTAATSGTTDTEIYCSPSGGPQYYCWGAQLETGSVATSYIPTTTGQGSRSADVISVSGAVSGSIGQTQGTIYAEVDVRTFASSAARRIVNLRVDDSNLLSLEINTASTNIEFVATSGGVSVNAVASGLTAGINKIAVGYNSAASGTVLYVNGTLRDTKTIAIPNLSTAVFGLGVRGDGGAGTQLNDRIRAAALYTTRLTNAELATLTTP